MAARNRKWTTVHEALRNLDDIVADKGEPRLSDTLEPGSDRAAIVSRLTKAGVSPHRDIVDWFSFHDGGWLPTTRWHLLSLEAALSARSDLIVYLGGAPEVETWMPFMTDSSETYVLDTSTGSVLHFDLVQGLTELEPSLPRWIRVATEPSQGITPLFGGEHMTPIRLATPLPRSAPPNAVAAPAPVSRTEVDASPRSWSAPASSEIVSVATPGGDLVAAINRNGFGELVSLDPGGSPPAHGLARVAETVWRSRGLAVSPAIPVALVNARWIFDFESGTGDVLVELARYPRGRSSISWSADGRNALLTPRADEMARPALVDCLARQVRFVDPGAELWADSVVWFAYPDTPYGDNPQDIRIESVDGRARTDVPPADIGFRRRGAPPIIAKDAPVAVVGSGSGREGIVLVDLSAGTARLATDEDLRPHDIDPRAETIMATRDGFPVVENYRITAATGRVDQIGSPQPESAPNGVTSPDWRFFAHHVVLPNHRVGVELVELETGATSSIELRGGSRLDLMVPVHFAAGALLFEDGNPDGRLAVYSAAIVDGRLDRIVELGERSSRGALKLSSNASVVVWPADDGLRWSAANGSGPLYRQHMDQRFTWRVDLADRLITHDARSIDVVELPG